MGKISFQTRNENTVKISWRGTLLPLLQGQHGCDQPVTCGCPASQAHPGYLGHCPHHPGYRCHHDLLVSVPGHCSHHLSNADSSGSQWGCLRPLRVGWHVIRTQVSPRLFSERLRSWTCILVLILQLANSVDLIKGPNSVGTRLLSVHLGVMIPPSYFTGLRTMGLSGGDSCS